MTFCSWYIITCMQWIKCYYQMYNNNAEIEYFSFSDLLGKFYWFLMLKKSEENWKPQWFSKFFFQFQTIQSFFLWRQENYQTQIAIKYLFYLWSFFLFWKCSLYFKFVIKILRLNMKIYFYSILVRPNGIKSCIMIDLVMIDSKLIFKICRIW